MGTWNGIESREDPEDTVKRLHHTASNPGPSHHEALAAISKLQRYPQDIDLCSAHKLGGNLIVFGHDTRLESHSKHENK